MLMPSATAPLLRIVLYRATSFGDVILATACLDLLASLPLTTEITWLGRGPALDVITASWPQVKTVTVNRDFTTHDLQKVVADLAGNHLFIDLQCNLRSRWLARSVKSAHGIPGFSADKAQLARGRLLLEARVRGRRRPLPEKSRLPARWQYAMMCDALRMGLKHQLPADMHGALERTPCRPRLPIPAAVDPPWRKELRFGAWLGVAPGAAHATKQTPLPVVRAILEQVLAGWAGTGAKEAPGLVFFGDDHDRQVARQLLDQLPWPGQVLNLAGRLSLWETAVALSETGALLSNDSSLGHISEAVDTPTAILFGPTIESFGFAPRMRQSRAFSTLLGCRPCSKHGKVSCRFGDKLCFTTLDVAAVASHLLTLLFAPDGTRQPKPVGPTGVSSEHQLSPVGSMQR